MAGPSSEPSRSNPGRLRQWNKSTWARPVSRFHSLSATYPQSESFEIASITNNLLRSNSQQRVTRGRSHAPADQIDLDQRVIGQAGDAHASAGRQAVGRKIAAVGVVHRGIIVLEAREIDPRHDDMFEAETKA